MKTIKKKELLLLVILLIITILTLYACLFKTSIELGTIFIERVPPYLNLSLLATFTLITISLLYVIKSKKTNSEREKESFGDGAYIGIKFGLIVFPLTLYALFFSIIYKIIIGISVAIVLNLFLISFYDLGTSAISTRKERIRVAFGIQLGLSLTLALLIGVFSGITEGLLIGLIILINIMIFSTIIITTIIIIVIGLKTIVRKIRKIIYKKRGY